MRLTLLILRYYVIITDDVSIEEAIFEVFLRK
jgi:hypothetical protein